MYKIGIIGLGGQSVKIIKYLKKKNIDPICIFIPKIKEKHKNFRNLSTSFKDIQICNIVFICSPNHTHFFYIKKLLKDKTKYIFCEKPPVNNIKDLKALKKLSYSKIYFNYNYRFSHLANILKNSYKYKLGKFLYGSLAIGHGLATKKNYHKSWRADKLKTPFGIIEVLSIHSIDLISYIFGISKIYFNKLNIAKKTKNFDTVSIKTITKDKKSIEIFNSYSSPLIEKKIFIFENGYVHQNENYINIFGPKNNFDKNGRFKKPKIIKKFKIKPEKDFGNSINLSINYFLDVIRKKKKFSQKLFLDSIKSNELILDSIKN